MNLALRLRPFANRARRALLGRRALEDAAVERETLQAAETEALPPPLALPDASARATAGCPGHSTLAEERHRAEITQVVHDAVVRYVLEDALVHPGGIEVPGAARLFAPADAAALRAPIARLPCAAYAATGATQRYFGHWLRDGCTTALLARDGEALLLDMRSDWPDVPAYLGALGLAPAPGALFRVGRLAVFDDHGQGALKRARYAELRRRVAEAWPGSGTDPAARTGTGRETTRDAARVFFRRGASGQPRGIANEEALVAFLKGRGFEVVDLAGARADALVRRFRAADLVLSVDGSHVNHAYLGLRPGAALLTLIPADRFTMVHRFCAHAFGLRYGYAVMARAGAGWAVDLDRLAALLDRVGLAQRPG